MPPTDPTDCLYYLISRATLSATAALKRGFATADVQDVKPAYLGVLLALWRHDGQRTAELGRRAGLEPSSMTGLLDRMERDGLIQRHADPDDRRAQCIALTDRGRHCELGVMGVVDETLARVTLGVDEDEVDQLKHLLRRMLANGRDERSSAATAPATAAQEVRR